MNHLRDFLLTLAELLSRAASWLRSAAMRLYAMEHVPEEPVRPEPPRAPELRLISGGRRESEVIQGPWRSRRGNEPPTPAA